MKDGKMELSVLQPDQEDNAADERIEARTEEMERKTAWCCWYGVMVSFSNFINGELNAALPHFIAIGSQGVLICPSVTQSVTQKLVSIKRANSKHIPNH